jgi:hypothetical protein
MHRKKQRNDDVALFVSDGCFMLSKNATFYLRF